MPTVIETIDTPYQGWLKLRRAHMRDEHGQTFTREIEDHGRGVAVLPYDPERRTALVVRLARAPVIYVGETALLIEAPAGLLEDGEEPAEAARREAFEEAGVALTTLEPLGEIWTMPGISTERMFMYLGAYSAASRTGTGGGLAEEHENITVEEMPLAGLAAMADANRLTDIRTLLLVTTLRLRHPALFA